MTTEREFRQEQERVVKQAQQKKTKDKMTKFVLIGVLVVFAIFFAI
jgi:hypothetical protein